MDIEPYKAIIAQRKIVDISCDKHILKYIGTGVSITELKVYVFSCRNCWREFAYFKTPVKKALTTKYKIRWYHRSRLWL